MSHDATERIFPLCSLREVVMYINIHKNQLSIMYLNYAAYCISILSHGLECLDKGTYTHRCYLHYKAQACVYSLYQGYLTNPCLSWILITVNSSCMEGASSIHKHCLPKKSCQNNWKSQQLLPHGMPLLNNPWMYSISCMSSSHSLQQLLTKLPQP